jgi:hypothetical protein
MKQIPLFLLSILFFVPLCFSGEVTVKTSYSIPDGSFVKLEEFRFSNYYCVKLYYDKFNNGTIYQYEVLRVYDDETIGYVQPMLYKDSGEKVFDTLVLNGVEYNPFTGEVKQVTENDNETENNDDTGDLGDNMINVVNLNRIELYLLWLLCVQAISCGVLLFLCFKGFEKL